MEGRRLADTLQFACVDDVHGFTPCTDQAQIDEYIRTAVRVFEGDSRVAAYAFSNGYGLGDVWPAMKNGQLRYVAVSLPVLAIFAGHSMRSATG